MCFPIFHIPFRRHLLSKPNGVIKVTQISFRLYQFNDYLKRFIPVEGCCESATAFVTRISIKFHLKWLTIPNVLCLVYLLRRASFFPGPAWVAFWGGLLGEVDILWLIDFCLPSIMHNILHASPAFCRWTGSVPGPGSVSLSLFC